MLDDSIKIKLSLHPAQAEVFYSPKRFQVVAAGRRFGKTYLACTKLINWAMTCPEHIPFSKRNLYYVAPTFQQAKDIAWNLLKEMLGPLLATAHENTGVATLINGCRISLKGSDRPDTLRGVPLLGCVIDEYADMKEEVWEMIIAPCLTDLEGPCLFIGTPKGRNHFYNLAEEAKVQDDWGYWHFTSHDNPFLPAKEVEAQRRRMSTFAFQQEFEASFNTAASDIFQPDWIRENPREPEDGFFVVTVDLAGFEAEATGAKTKNRGSRLDNTAISIVKVHGEMEWWLKDQVRGRWTVEQTAEKIVRAAQDAQVIEIGIEKGLAQQAIIPYLKDAMSRLGYSFNIRLLTHGNKRKYDRIVWALQGRMEKGFLTFNPGPYLRDLRDELLQFPSPQTKDDGPDSLAYVDQMVETLPYFEDSSEDEWEPTDDISGY